MTNPQMNALALEPPQSRSIQMPSSFFKSAKREYKDWRFAMVREFIQNSYDAGAGIIRFTVGQSARGNTFIEVQDDGSGMDEDTLLNVLLCMGGSRKPSGAVGGFGYAKTILLLAHHAYWLQTVNGDGHVRNVTGCGGSYAYTIRRSVDAATPGTTIKVEIDDSQGVEDWVERIRRYARLCCMEYFTGRAVHIVLDREELPQNNDTAYDYQVESQVGSFWFNEREDSTEKVSSFVVHVQGLPMFIEQVYGATGRIHVSGGIELASGSSALTCNRDGLTGDYYQQFRECLAEIVGKQSALKYGNAVSMLINSSVNDLYGAGQGSRPTRLQAHICFRPAVLPRMSKAALRASCAGRT